MKGTALAKSILVHLTLIGVAIFFLRKSSSYKSPEVLISSFNVSLGQPSKPESRPNPQKQKSADASYSKSDTSAAPSEQSPPPKITGNSPARATSIDPRTFADIRTKISENLHYPISLQRRGLVGRTVIELALAADGKAESVSVIQSSGHAELDELAIAAARESSPFSAQPYAIRLTLPIEFKSAH